MVCFVQFSFKSISLLIRFGSRKCLCDVEVSSFEKSVHLGSLTYGMFCGVLFQIYYLVNLSKLKFYKFRTKIRQKHCGVFDMCVQYVFKLVFN